MSQKDIALQPGETVVVQAQFIEGGFLGFLLKILGPLLNAEKTLAAVVTDQRVVKKGSNGVDLSLPLSEIAMVYRNTSSDSLAVVGKDQSQSLLIARVANCDAFVDALRDKGIAVENESTSPKRRYLR